MARGNPKPVQSEGFKASQWPKIPGFKSGTKPIGVRFAVEVYEFLNTLPDRQQFIRDAVDVAIAKHKSKEGDRA